MKQFNDQDAAKRALASLERPYEAPVARRFGSPNDTEIFGNLDKMLNNSGGSKFMLVNIVRKRAAQLNNGAPPLTDRVNPNKPVSTAFNEIGNGMIPFEAAPQPASPIHKAS